MARELTGYSDPFNIDQGGTVQFKVSTDEVAYRADIVRLIHGDQSGPGFKEESIEALGEFPGRHQKARAGSYGLIPRFQTNSPPSSFSVQLWVRPTKPTCNGLQGLLSLGQGATAFLLGIGTGGECVAAVGSPETNETVSSGASLSYNQWCFVAAVYDNRLRRLELHQRPYSKSQKAQRSFVRVSVEGVKPEILGHVLIGAAIRTGQEVEGHYNGRIEGPSVYGRCLSGEELDALENGVDPCQVAPEALLAHWDFGLGIQSHQIIDRGPSAANGVLINSPARAVTGHRWDGSHFDFKAAPEQFAAVHFHDDDLDDAQWETDLSWTVPSSARSGVYALRLRAKELEDHIPFVVRIGASAKRAKAVVLVPTMTYTAYANQTLQELEPYQAFFRGREMNANKWDQYLVDHKELGLSIYDAHSDGSPVFYSSLRRPIPNLRPQYRQWQFGTPRHLGADLYLIDWLEAKGFEYDVITDHDLHEQGKELLSQYSVLLTGTHPEYWTVAMRGTLEDFLYSGGRQMYLGGNGFFWVTSVDPERPYSIEVRKGPWGPTASSDIEAERHHSTTGERGGLWRDRGKPPNQVAGIGTAAMGYDNVAPGYRRQPGSFVPDAAFIFEGVGADELIGDFGLVFNGAAGDEIDCFDPDVETPSGTLVLATATEFGPTYFPIVDGFGELLDYTRSRTNASKIKSDMVYFKTPDGGEVFSVGSISWCASLSHNHYDNNVSRITENVLRAFTKDNSTDRQ